MALQLTYWGSRPADNTDHFEYRFTVRSLPDGMRVRAAKLRLDNGDREGWIEAHRSKMEDPTAAADRAMEAEAVRRLESLGSTLGEAETTLVLDATYADLDRAVSRGKVCDYQDRRGRDLVCLAAEHAESQTAGTSRHACENQCPVPDSRVLCSLFMHTTITIERGGAPEPDVLNAVCDAGFDDKIRYENLCRPGENECWRRIIETSAPNVAPPLPPLALPEAFDHLAAVWAVKFPGQPPFIQLSTLATAGELELGCASRDEFKSRLSVLGDALKKINVDKALLTDKGLHPNATLKRIDDALKTKLGSNPAKSAIDELEAVTGIRVGYQHSDATAEQATHARAIGLAWPPADWSEAWDHVRAQVVSALREVRRAVESIP